MFSPSGLGMVTRRKILCLFCFCFFGSCKAAAADHANPTILLPGNPIDENLEGKRVDIYKLNLRAHQFAHVTLKKEGIDVVITAFDVDGRQTPDMDFWTATRGTDDIWFLANKTGACRIQVKARNSSMKGGSYQIEVAEVRAEEGEDKQRIAVQQNLAEGLLLLDSPKLGSVSDLRAEIALQEAREIGDQRTETSALYLLAKLERAAGKIDQAVGYGEQALAISKDQTDRGREGAVLFLLGSSYRASGQNEKATDRFQQALAISREIEDRAGEADALSGLGSVYASLSQYDKAVTFDEQAQKIFQETKNQAGVASSLYDQGVACNRIGFSDKAILFLTQSREIWQEIDPTREAAALVELGWAYSFTGKYQEAATAGEQALAISRQSNRPGLEAGAMVQLGNVYANLSQYEKASSLEEQALGIYKAEKNQAGEAAALNQQGSVYNETTQYEKAIDLEEQALVICRAAKERQEEARALLNLGISYDHLVQYDKAFDYFKQSLQIWEELNNFRAMGRTMNALAVMWERDGSHQKAIDIYQQLLPIQSKMLKDRIGEAITLDNLGFSYASLGRYDTAIDYYKQSLEVQKQTGRLTGAAPPLHNMGLAYFKLGRYREAAACYEQALAARRQAKDRMGEALTLANLMSTWSALQAPRLAIFFGKESVNAHQEIRQNIRGLDQSSRTKYIKSYGVTYRQLADLLAREGRLGEAEEVLDLLKEEEFFVYVRGAEMGSPENKSVPLTNPEIQMHEQLLSKGDVIAALAIEKRDLEVKVSRTADEEENLQQLNAKIDEATRDFQQFLDQLSVEFDKQPQGDARRLRFAHAEALMGTLGELGKGTVALYTLVSEQKYRVILTTSEVEIAGEFAISSTDLNRKVEQFRQVLQDRQSDPRPLAEELYRILLGPVENELKGANAETLMWSLDGSLRYLPVAALYDGQKYLVERYRNEVFNPESLDRLKDSVSHHWRGVGLGVSKSVDNFPPLPGVPSELRGIIRTGSDDGSKGVVPGVLRLNEQFTWDTMQSDLRHSPSMVHIASHFAFKSDIQSSFLLLGNGQKLTLSELRTVPNLFQGVELLTLSACRTAMGGEEESGSELDGFAMLAQRKGAKSVLATLWPVADSSTAILMREFYRIRESDPGMTKAEALRQAQTFMLQGNYDPPSAQSHTEGNTSGPRPAEISGRETYSHPYFWAPFILIGNWK